MATQLLPERFNRPALTLLILAYLSGIVGLLVPALVPYFRPLVPFNLLVSLLLLLLYHTDWQPSFLFYCIFTFCIGFLVEVLGVHTGYVFGNYTYGPTLGWGLWEVPLIIGANWLTLTYCCGVVCDRIAAPVYMKTILAASLMVLLDLFIEPVAIRLDFWTWADPEIPIRNYVGWWFVSLVILAIWYGLPFRKENRLAVPLLVLQFLFFILTGLIMRLSAS